MAVKPYQEGPVWSFRLRVKGQDIYRTGFATQAEARRESERLRHKVLDAGKPKHDGPWKTTLAQALSLYGVERLPTLKGAQQEARRINRYLRFADLKTLKLTRPTDPATGSYWTVTFERAGAPRKIPNSLRAHRTAQRERSAKTQRLLHQLAKTPVAQVMRYQLQDLIDAMIADGYEPATIGLERALLRQLFNYARKTWHWPEPTSNPASGLTMPKIDNSRDRVLTNKEWRELCEALARRKNRYVGPALGLLLETAMRVSEPLLRATWADLDEGRCLLRLRDAKAGARDVPLNASAMAILETLKLMRDPGDPESRILPITYETLKSAWDRACAEAGIENAHIHDLRHTSATRFTLELNGNLPVLKVITGHKTYSQLNRYINVKPADVSRLLHGRPLTEDDAPAGLHLARPKLAPPAQPIVNADDLPKNVVLLRRA